MNHINAGHDDGHPGFSSFKLKTLQLANRWVVAPMSRVSATNQGLTTNNMKRYYTSFAEGGFGIIITEGLYTDVLYSQAYPNQPGLATLQQVQHWLPITSAVHEKQSNIIAQLMHAGSLSQCLTSTRAPSAVQPSGRKMTAYGGGGGRFPLPKQMTNDEIHQVIEGFVTAARNASAAGFDGVEIHAANGYLLDQFLTSYTNLRSDEWGGTTTNRFRIIHTIISKIRAAVPGNFVVGLRLSEGKVNNLFYRWPQGAAMAKTWANEVHNIKPDYVHIAAESGNWQRDCNYTDGTSLTGIMKHLADVPVIANGGLHDLNESHRVISGGHADLIAIGSAALADPSWPRKIAEGIEPVKFVPGLIKPLATIEHTWQVQMQESGIANGGCVHQARKPD